MATSLMNADFCSSSSYCTAAIIGRRRRQQPPFDLVITNGHIIDGTGLALVFGRYRYSQRQRSPPSAT